jgi:hypothetical protein
MKRSVTVGERVRDMKELEPRFFVVDDDQSVRTILANLLATEDYAVEISRTPPGIWRACRTPAQRASCSTCSCPDSTVWHFNTKSRRKVEWSRSSLSPGTAIYQWGSMR